MRSLMCPILCACVVLASACGREDGRPHDLVGSDVHGTEQIGGFDRVGFSADVAGTGECVGIGLRSPSRADHAAGLVLPSGWEVENVSVRPGPCSNPSDENLDAVAVTGSIRFDPGSTAYPPPATVDLEFSRGPEANPPVVWMSGRVEAYR